MISKKDFIKINDWLWEIPKSFRSDMKVPVRIYVSEEMLDEVESEALEQLVNTATLPGIVEYAIAMPDIHSGYGFCLHPDTKILTDFGFHLLIKNFQKIWKNQSLKIIDFNSRNLAEAFIQGFFKIKPRKKILKIVAETGKEIVATEDHPFYTPKGMIQSGKLKIGDQVAIFPFEGVPYEKPSTKVIISENEIKKTLFKLGRKSGEVGFDQNIRVLTTRNLLPLTYDHSKLPYILKIMGFVFGDGSMNFIGKRDDGIIHFSSKNREDLEEIRKDVRKVGYTPSPIHIHKSKRFYKGQKKIDINHSFCINASSLVILLQTLGLPRGNKTFQAYRVPKWIFNCPLWQKRLFLASFFGAELRMPHRRKGRGTMFNCPILQMNKAENLISNGKIFLNDISKLLKEFNVETIYINQRKKHINKKGEITWGLELVFSSRIKNLLNLWSKIGFEYNKKRNFLANVVTQYLKYKRRILEEKEKAIKIEIPQLLKTGLSYQKIASRLATGNPLTERFIVDVCWKINKGLKNISPQVSQNFPKFSEYFKEITKHLGKNGMVWDKISEIREILYKGFVYDFTIDHPDHNFIANNFVVSNCIGGVAAMNMTGGVISPGGVGYDINCGMRLLKSHYLEKDIKPQLEKLATEIQKEVPSGLGQGRQIKLSIGQINKILEGGAKRLVEQGYGEKEDIENCEAYGCLDWADASTVSERAKNRGRDQVGTLGSGNHFLEIQKVAEIFDKVTAKNFGLFQNQIVIMIHTGSRGLGHQIATDYIKIMMRAMAKYGIKLPDKELAACPINSPEGKKYFAAMACGANYAWANRQMITHFIRKAWKNVLGERSSNLSVLYDVAHNIAKIERHIIDEKEIDLCVHRKGATRAFPPFYSEIPERYKEVGQPVLIPGSMGTASYILVGAEKGEEVFFSTCHGAGRTMSRHAALRAVSGQEVVRDLESKGIIIKCWNLRSIAEEAPLAYKNIHDVIEVVHNAGLSKKVACLIPLAVIKGE